MARIRRFTLLCDDNERRLISVLAKRLQRSQSDAIRFLLREKANELGVNGKLIVMENRPMKQ